MQTVKVNYEGAVRLHVEDGVNEKLTSRLVSSRQIADSQVHVRQNGELVCGFKR